MGYEHRARTQLRPNPLHGHPPQDGWAVTREGGLVLVRSNDYHVEWWSDRAVATRGAPISTPRVPVIRADRVAYTRRFLEGSSKVPPWAAEVVPTAHRASTVPVRARATRKRVRLPADRRLLTLGRSSVYLIAMDEDGFEKVERYVVH